MLIEDQNYKRGKQEAEESRGRSQPKRPAWTPTANPETSSSLRPATASPEIQAGRGCSPELRYNPRGGCLSAGWQVNLGCEYLGPIVVSNRMPSPAPEEDGLFLFPY